MLKINKKIDFVSSFEKWNENKNCTIFRNEKDLKIFQKHYLKLLLNNKKKYEPLKLMSSGTTSNIPKKYDFPKELYAIIENHHIWKIMQSHNIQPGNVIKIFQVSSKSKINNFFDESPKKNPSLGLMNDSWELYYDPKITNPYFWKKTFNFIKDKKPKFIFTSPSVFECFYEKINHIFDFPIIFSCEMLTDVVRTKAEKVFSKSIDKMKDWTTGFGFFECKLGTKHIYDDLCVSEQLDENLIQSIDLFNYCENNPKKISDDRGIIKKKLCNCGLYGNILDSFEGKFFEHLVSIKGKKYSANYISNMLSCFDFSMSYEIIQDKNKNIIFKTKENLSDKQAILIGKNIKNIIMDDNQDLNLHNQNKTIWYSKKSNISLVFKKEEFKIYNNKKISLRNFV